MLALLTGSRGQCALKDCEILRPCAQAIDSFQHDNLSKSSGATLFGLDFGPTSC